MVLRARTLYPGTSLKLHQGPIRSFRIGWRGAGCHFLDYYLDDWRHCIVTRRGVEDCRGLARRRACHGPCWLRQTPNLDGVGEQASRSFQ